MKLGNKIFSIIVFLFLYTSICSADERIISTPLINIDKIKPSFEELDDDSENIILEQN